MLLVRSLFVLLFAFLLIGIVVLDWYLTDTSPWLHFESSTKELMGGVPFCEHDRSSNLLRERANSLSDFSFLAVGFYMLVRSIEFQKKSRAKNTILSTINGLANCGHAVGSWLNHACRCQLGHRLDLTGMWLITSFIALYSLTRRASIKTGAFAFIFLIITYILWVASDVYYPESYENREKILIVGLCVIFFLSESVQMKSLPITKKQMKLLGLSVVALAVGTVCGHLDARKVVCWPQSWFQLHAVWHICAACSVLAIYEYFRCEKSITITNTDHLA
jgi:hypothetical protein